ncbi:MAG: hypothetical protein K1000chlam2_00111 [Chlamydiae bacterium]|nr:hypothetical protein [Chlamydiota bacterium]
MKKKRIRRQAFTLLEIMVVIFLIGLIGSIIGYNMKGSIDEGKAFKSKQAKIRLQEILELELAKGASAIDIVEKTEAILEGSKIIKNPKNLVKDGWGEPFRIKVNAAKEVSVKSSRLKAYLRKQAEKRGYAEEEE